MNKTEWVEVLRNEESDKDIFLAVKLLKFWLFLFPDIQSFFSFSI